MMIDPEGHGHAGCVDPAGIDRRGPFALQQARVAGGGVESEQQPGLGHDVDVQLQSIGYAAVPHRHGEQVVVGAGEAVGDGDDLVPGGLAGAVQCALTEERHLRRRLVAVELGQRLAPQIDLVDLSARVPGAVGRQEGLGHTRRRGLLAARRAFHEQQFHDYPLTGLER